MRPPRFAAPLAAFAVFYASSGLGETGSETDKSGLETVVVTGRASAWLAEQASIGRIPGGASFVDIETVREGNVSSLADVLRYVPGVWVASHAGNDGIFFSSRGSNLDATDWDMNGLKLLQDGLPVTAADGSNHNRIIDPLAARQVIIARGANALEHGASTLGGAVNFISPTGIDSPGFDVAANFGSHGFALGRLSFGTAIGESSDAYVSVETKKRDGHRQHSVEERLGLYANAGLRPSERVSTRIYVAALEIDHELPGALTRSEFDADPKLANPAATVGHYQRNVSARRIANKTKWNLAEGDLEFGASYEEQSLYHPIVWAEVNGVEVFSLLVDTDHRDVATSLRYARPFGSHDLLFGVNHAESKVTGGNYRNLGGRPNGLREHLRNEAETTEVFAVDHWQVRDRLAVVLGAQAAWAQRDVRVESASSGDVRNPKARYSRFSPRVGVLRDVGRSATLYGNLSKLFEPPTNYELEDNAAGGSATLNAMTGTVLEFGARRLAGGHDSWGWKWDVSLYYAEIDDAILAVEDPDAPGTSLVTNIDNAIHAGLEAVFGAMFPLGPGGATVEPILSVTVNELRFDHDALYGRNRLPAAPRHFVRGEVLYRSARGWHVGPTFDVVGPRWADFANTYRIDSHTLVGLRGGWANDRWQAFAELRNLTDRAYVVTHSVRAAARPDDAILNPGEPRSAYVGFQVRFE